MKVSAFLLLCLMALGTACSSTKTDTSTTVTDSTAATVTDTTATMASDSAVSDTTKRDSIK